MRAIGAIIGWVVLALVLILAFTFIINLALVSALVSGAQSADLFQALPEGRAGEGHDANHLHYEGLKSPDGFSCCNGRDCRPTQARQIDGHWEIMVNGIWRSDFTSGKILTDAWLRLEDARLRRPVEGRWNTEAHVCASIEAQYSGATTPARPNIYCVILTDIWN